MLKVSGRLHVRQQLEKIMNQIVIVKVCYGSDDGEEMHEENAEGSFKGKRQRKTVKVNK